MFQNSQDSVFSDRTIDPHFSTTKKTLDPIHDFIVFDSDVWNVIDTPEFQRLRDIKQLGGVVYVFPGANHTRFEHCLGTAHLAQKLVKSIYKYQPSVFGGFDSEEHANQVKKNVTLAGLLHDLGHGPFSHLFDGKIIPALCPGSDWSHEKGSAMLMDKLIEDNNIDIENEDKTMISNLILGKRSAHTGENMWIFDIVANSKNSIDVDKYDYMARDSYHLGLKDTSFDYRGLVKESRVIEEEICFPAKMCHKVYELFQVRYKLYKEIYHNRAAKAVEIMLTEILLNANSRYNFPEIVNNPEEYMKLTDYIIKEIELSKEPELEVSRKLLQRLRKRDIYKFASEAIVDTTKVPLSNDERMKVDILSCAQNDGTERDLHMEDFHVVKNTNTFGFKDKNPVDCVRFYNKNNITKSMLIDKEQVSLLLPSRFSETFIRIYTVKPEKVETARKAFSVYCEKFLHTKMGPVESKNFSDFGTKIKRLNSNEDVAELEPGVGKGFLTNGRTFVSQQAVDFRGLD